METVRESSDALHQVITVSKKHSDLHLPNKDRFKVICEDPGKFIRDLQIILLISIGSTFDFTLDQTLIRADVSVATRFWQTEGTCTKLSYSTN